jgi:hypothetical protein
MSFDQEILLALVWLIDGLQGAANDDFRLVDP